MSKGEAAPIRGIGKDENKLIVHKSLPLFNLWRSDLTLAEFKILDTYLSRIDSHDPDRRVVEFEKGEMEKLLGVQRIRNKELKERLTHLMGNVVEIPDSDEKKGFRLVTLFEEAEAEQDDYGVWQIKLEATQKAMKYFFNIENLGYLRYKLRCITSLGSRYTYILFLYLEANRFRKSWRVPLDELRMTLKCDKEETYQEYKRFNDLILKKCYRELNEKTECRYTYTPIRSGRRVVAIKFTLETLSDAILSGKKEELSVADKEMSAVSQGRVAEKDSVISKDEREMLLFLLRSKGVASPEERLDYFIMAMKYQEEKSGKPIRNKFNYLKKSIENDKTKNANSESKTPSWSSINYDELENLGVYMDMDK